jgi:hypothetical protein
MTIFLLGNLLLRYHCFLMTMSCAGAAGGSGVSPASFHHMAMPGWLISNDRPESMKDEAGAGAGAGDGEVPPYKHGREMYAVKT